MAVEDDSDDEVYRQQQLALKMMKLLEEHGWDFTLGRDPVLILIEVEEKLNDGDIENE